MGAKRQLKTYEEWIATAPPERLESVKRVFGDLRAFYDRFKAEWLNDQEQLRVIRGKLPLDLDPIGKKTQTPTRMKNK